MTDSTAPTRPLALLSCIGATSLAGAIAGGLTNAASAGFDTEFFRAALRWWDIKDVWRAAIAEGVFAGALIGFFGSLVFALWIGLATRCRIGHAALLRALALCAGTAIAAWVVGGLIGIGIAHLSPERFERLFWIPEGQEVDFDATTFGWCGGSIAGLNLGALAGMVVAGVQVRSRWKSEQATQS